MTYGAQGHRTSNAKQQGTHSIPSADSGESIGVTARIRAAYDIGESFAAAPVQPGVEEAKRFLAVGNPVVIEHRYHGRYHL